MQFPMTIKGASLRVVIEYSVAMGEVEVEDIKVYDAYDQFQWNNLTPILSQDTMNEIEAEFYYQLPEGEDYEQD